MLKRLRFKNWRSLRDVTIDDLGPITVLIGANSSGKSNIVDGLRFLRQMLIENKPDKTFFLENRRRILNSGAAEDEDIQISLLATTIADEFEYDLRIEQENKIPHFHEVLKSPVSITTSKDGHATSTEGDRITVYLGVPSLSLYLASCVPTKGLVPLPHDPQSLNLSITNHWQILGENFQSQRSMSLDENKDVYLLEPDADNVVVVLDYMVQRFPGIFKQFQEDLQWLTPHVERLLVETDERETKMKVFEPNIMGQEAPTISGGTGRLIAILTAYYSLDMRYAELPGLVVIEEPDMAIHPQLLKNFVELIRSYTEDEKHPRQFIFTTHNPRFLDYFDPKEVRVVHRDEQGYTTVEKIPDYIREIWLDEYGLGEVWMTRSLGDSD